MILLNLIASILLIQITTISVWCNDMVEVGDPLFLTPYINGGQIEEAQNLAKNQNLSDQVISYSGLITVDEENGVHTFFWFFPAEENPETAPILLWSEGGPGVTGLFSAFAASSPFLVDVDGNLQLRETPWTRTHSVIYMDQPIDVGYSFTENQNGYPSSGTATAGNIYKFLLQFFKLFPDLQGNDFYNSGVSFGGIYSSAVAQYLHTQNNQNPEFKINLKGLLLETPFMDPISQINYGDFLYHSGLIDGNARTHFGAQFEVMKGLMAEGKYLEAQQMNLDLLWGSAYGTYFTNVTGYASNYNIIKTNLDMSQTYFAALVEKPFFRKAIHVGNLSFSLISPTVQTRFKPFILAESVKPILEELLEAGYKILILSGNLDIITCHFGVETMIKGLEWSGAEEYSKAERQLWRVGNELAGYATNVSNFTYVVMRNGGHGAAGEQQTWGYDLVHRFTRGLPFSK